MLQDPNFSQVSKSTDASQAARALTPAKARPINHAFMTGDFDAAFALLAEHLREHQIRLLPATLSLFCADCPTHKQSAQEQADRA